MNYHEAHAAITAILEQLPDDALPDARIEQGYPAGKTTAWFGGHGFTLNSTVLRSRSGVEESVGNRFRRRDGIDSLLEYERVHRLEAADNANGAT